MKLSKEQIRDILAIPPEIAQAPALYIESTKRCLYAVGVDPDQRDEIITEMSRQALNVCELMTSPDPTITHMRLQIFA